MAYLQLTIEQNELFVISIKTHFEIYIYFNIIKYIKNKTLNKCKNVNEYNLNGLLSTIKNTKLFIIFYTMI